jgi:hypothetical protein
MFRVLDDEWRYEYLGDGDRLTDLFLFRLLPLIGDGDEELDLEREYFLGIFLLLFLEIVDETLLDRDFLGAGELDLNFPSSFAHFASISVFIGYFSS